MKRATFDRDGYPTEETLKAFSQWPFEDPAGWLAFAESAWNKTYGHWRSNGPRITAVTGGWSGNEDVIEAMSDSYILWSLCWYMSKRGGLHEFKAPEGVRT